MTEYETRSLRLMASIVKGLQLSMVQSGVLSDSTSTKQEHQVTRDLVTQWKTDSDELLATFGLDS
jgi:hypothetical protein